MNKDVLSGWAGKIEDKEKKSITKMGGELFHYQKADEKFVCK